MPRQGSQALQLPPQLQPLRLCTPPAALEEGCNTCCRVGIQVCVCRNLLAVPLAAQRQPSRGSSSGSREGPHSTGSELQPKPPLLQ